MSSESTKLFKKFIRRWNDGSLSSMYYRGIPNDILESIKRTKHKWGFMKKLDEEERFKLATMKDSVDVSTNKQNSAGISSSKVSNSSSDKNRRSSSHREFIDDDVISDRKRDKYERKQLHKHHEIVAEELVPRATGRFEQ